MFYRGHWPSPSLITFFPISEFSYNLIRFLLHSSIVKSDNEIGNFFIWNVPGGFDHCTKSVSKLGTGKETQNGKMFQHQIKEVEIVYRLFLVNCYLLLVPRLSSQLASNVACLVIL